jgi:hypothetical protein
MTEAEMKGLFDRTRVTADAHTLTRLSAHAREVAIGRGQDIPSRLVWALGTLATLGLAWVLILGPGRATTAAEPVTVASADVLELAYGTYLDVGWDDDPLWGDPILGVHGGLTDQDLLDEYDALLEGPDQGARE